MKIVIAGGGTGGHLYPGIAVARELLSEAGTEVLFIGTEQGIEARVLPREGLPVRFITVGKLKGMGLVAALRTLVTLPRALLQSARLLRAARPDTVIGVGGYSSGPATLAAWLLRLPVILIEPNSYPGLVNRVMGRLAATVVLPFPGTNRLGFFPAQKTVETGPLVRTGIEQGDRAAALANFGLDANGYTVFVMGGSGGAHAVNMTMKEAAKLLKDVPGIQVLHQTGEKDAAELDASYRAVGMKARVLPFIHDMAGAYAAADLVVSRSGATTVAELAVCGKRAVLVPFPFAADNHQEHNARTLALSGQAEVILQKDLTPELLAGTIRKYAASRAVAARPKTNNAARDIVRIVREHVQED